MTASRMAKEAGLESLKEVSEISQVSRRTLADWFHNYPQRFKIILLGCAEEKKAWKEIEVLGFRRT